MLRELAPKGPPKDLVEQAGRKYIQDGQPEHYARVCNNPSAPPEEQTFSIRRRAPKPLSKKARRRA